MKKQICIVLTICILFSCTACAGRQQKLQVPADFYYCTSTITYDSPTGVIASESRETVSFSNDLTAIINHYLEGPQSDLLYSPFPAGSSVIRLQQTGSDISVVFNESFATLTGIKLTLACVCLAKTLFSLSESETVTIRARNSNLDGNRDITLTRNNVLTVDEIAEIDP